MIAARARVHRGAVVAAITIAAACGTGPASPKATAVSDALSGTLSVNVDRADDFGYRVELEIQEIGGLGVTMGKAELTLSAPGGTIVKPFDLIASKSLTASGGASQLLTFPNQPGLPLATTATAVIPYVDNLGRTGSLAVTKTVQACWNSYEAHCAATHLEAGQNAVCSGGIEWCSPMHLPLSGSQIQWQSTAPAVATVSKDGTLSGISNGSAVIVASFGSLAAVSHTFSVCVGPACSPD